MWIDKKQILVLHSQRLADILRGAEGGEEEIRADISDGFWVLKSGFG